MSLVELRPLNIGVNKCSDKTTTVRDRKLKSGRRGALVVAGAVVGVPNKDRWHRSVHSCGHEEGHAVFDLGMGHTDVGDHGVPDDGREESE